MRLLSFANCLSFFTSKKDKFGGRALRKCNLSNHKIRKTTGTSTASRTLPVNHKSSKTAKSRNYQTSAPLHVTHQPQQHRAVADLWLQLCDIQNKNYTQHQTQRTHAACTKHRVDTTPVTTARFQKQTT